MNLYEQTQAFSAELLTNERRAASAMVRSYSTAYSAIQSEIGNMQRRIATARAAGLDVSPAWLYQQGRLAVLQAQVLEQITKFGERADIILGGSINTASALGGTHAEALLATALPDGIAISPAMDPVRVGGAPTAAAASPFVAVVAEEVSLATGAIEKLTGALQPDAAVGRLLAQLGPDAAQAVTQALVQGLALGKNPQVVANGMRDALGGNLTRALTIARTETLRAYREASRATFTANASVLDGWTWVSALGKRTCASCFAQHGSVHPLTEVMATHPRCRCSMAPAPKSYRELGYGDTPESVKIEKGPDIFRRLPVDEQRATLGPSKLAALRSNGITLPDLVARKDSPVWGPGTSEASLAAARRNAALRKQAGAARPLVPARPQRAAAATAPPLSPAIQRPKRGLLHPRETVRLFAAKSGRKAETLRAINKGLDAVGKVLDLPISSTKRAVQVVYKARSNTQAGAYSARVVRASKASGSRTDRILSSNIEMVGDSIDTAVATFVHEYGHMLDMEMMGEATRGIKKGDELYEWMQTVKRSRGYNAVLQSGMDYGDRAYFLGADECFARSFAQYIATKNGDRVMASEIRDTWAGTRRRHNVDPQWQDDDFAPIAAALDNVFAARGWLR